MQYKLHNAILIQFW